MADVKYTLEQQRVIDYRGGNLLVSAAAGSGKTAVLVERIIKLIENKEVDINELLVLTFTNASAMEMKERIGSVLYKKFLETGDLLYREQILNLSISNISTFHSFCLKIIKDYFYKTPLDPNYRLADEQITKIMKDQAIKEVLEKNYEKNYEIMDEDFAFLDSAFEGIKIGSNIASLVLNLYEKAISRPKPKDWLKEVVKMQDIKTMDDYLASPIFEYAYNDVLDNLTFLKAKIDYSLEFIEDHHLDIKAVADIKAHLEACENMLALSEEPLSLMQALAGAVAIKNSRVVNKEDDPIIEKFKVLRKDVSDSAKKLTAYAKELLFDEDKLVSQERSYKLVSELSRLTAEFIDEYAKIKLKNNFIDFSDIEHLALLIVYDGDEISPEAIEIRDRFKEILIDEYQDTNYVQESLVKAISKEAIDEPNVFMVGDLKQSIYKFRNSAPEIFASKYKTYTREDSAYTAISLNKNFRSRKNVLHFINTIFTNIMSEKVGDLSYDHEAMLYKGRDFIGEEAEAELMLVSGSQSDIENEAIAVAKKIKELVSGEHYINDKDGKERKICYKDIVILTRAIKGRVEVFADVFKQMNIPLVTPSKTGFFGALEIVTLLNVLMIVDNPLQDIALISVLKSGIFSFSDDELVSIKYFDEEKRTADFYYLLENYAKNNEDDLALKINKFLTKLKKWREAKNDLSVYELLSRIIDECKYFNLASLAFDGKNSVNNVRALLKQAYEFESDSYKGLYAFNKYIETLKSKDIDFGLSNQMEDDDFVTIMTIHNSKGLEFPVVFLSTMQKQFNKMDSRSKLVVHDKFGLGVDIYYPEDEVVVNSPIKRIVKSAIDADNLSEELRLLYVALTRAKERLILSAGVSEQYLEKLEQKIEEYRMGGEVSPTLVASSKGLLDLVLIGLSRTSIFDEVFEEKFSSAVEEPKMKLELVKLEDESFERGLYHKEGALDEKTKEEIRKNLAFSYKYEAKTREVLRTTVSKLKEGAEKPSFRGLVQAIDDDSISGARLGTVYHDIMRIIDFSSIKSLEDVERFLDNLEQEEFLTSEEKDAVEAKKIYGFITSKMGQRVVKAYADGKVYRERTFILGEDVGDDDVVLVQGMIDLYFIEDGKIILLDYKTDKVREGYEKVLAERYSVQMSYYKKALKGFSDLEVSEVALYSFTLGKTIFLDI